MNEASPPPHRPINPLHVTYRWIKRIVLVAAGFSVLIVGIAMIVLPGPAVLVIPIGLGILGLEFAWARRWLAQLRERSRAVADAVAAARKRSSGDHSL